MTEANETNPPAGRISVRQLPKAVKRRALLYGLGAMMLVLLGALIASFVMGGSDDNSPDLSANRGNVIGLAPLGKGADLIGKPLPQTGVVTLDGKLTNLSSLANGQPVLINFFSRTCVPCVQEMPALQRRYAAAGGKLRFIGSDVGDSLEDTKAFVASTKVTYPVARDPQSLVLTGFGVGSLPTTLAVSSDGRIIGQHYGAFTGDDLDKFVEKHLPSAG